MKQYSSGDIVLLNFPFTTSSQTKRRPALILLDTGDDDIIVARVSSQSHSTEFDVTINEWQKAGLLRPSVVRLHKINTLSKSIVERKLGVLTTNDWQKIQTKLITIWTFNQSS